MYSLHHSVFTTLLIAYHVLYFSDSTDKVYVLFNNEVLYNRLIVIFHIALSIALAFVLFYMLHH